MGHKSNTPNVKVRGGHKGVAPPCNCLTVIFLVLECIAVARMK